MEGIAYVGQKRVAEATVTCQVIDTLRERVDDDVPGEGA
jgi:hypothetical protein